MVSIIRWKSAALGLALVRTSQAIPGWSRSGTIVEGNASQFDQTTWEQNLDHPNATGDFPITGFDITKAYTTSAQAVGGWALAVNVTSGIPDANTQNPSNASGQVFTGTSIYLTAPADIAAAIGADPDAAADNTTWKICVTVMTGAPETGADGNGTCSSLSSQCAADFQDAYAGQFAKLQDCYSQPPTPDSCGDALSQANLTTQRMLKLSCLPETLEPFSHVFDAAPQLKVALEYALDHINGTEVFVTASGPHDADDNSAYNSAVKTEWPVLIVWGWNARANVSDGTTPTVQLTCARANNTGGGGGSSGSAASRSHGSAAIAFAVAGLAAVLVL